MKLFITIVTALLLAGCATCPSDVVYIPVPINPTNVAYTPGKGLYQFLRIKPGDIEKYGLTREEAQSTLKKCYRVVYQALPIQFDILTEEEIEEFDE